MANRYAISLNGALHAAFKAECQGKGISMQQQLEHLLASTLEDLLESPEAVVTSAAASVFGDSVWSIEPYFAGWSVMLIDGRSVTLNELVQFSRLCYHGEVGISHPCEIDEWCCGVLEVRVVFDVS